jgi:hypothetical protein
LCSEVEKQERSASEHKALQLLQDVRKKWYLAEEERTEKIRWASIVKGQCHKILHVKCCESWMFIPDPVS